MTFNQQENVYEVRTSALRDASLWMETVGQTKTEQSSAGEPTTGYFQNSVFVWEFGPEIEMSQTLFSQFLGSIYIK